LLGKGCRDGLECRALLRGDRRSRRQHHAQRILVHVVDAEFVVQVRSRSEPGRPDKSDDLSLCDTCTLADALGKAREMAVPGRVLGLVTEDDQIAVTPLPSRELHDAVAGRLHTGACRRPVVYAPVRAPRLEHRMEARAAEAGSDPRELQRGAQECLAYVLALNRVIAAFAIRVLEIDGLIDLPVVDEFGGEHAAGLELLTLVVEGLVNDGKAVPAPQVTVEVDVGGEDIGDLGRDRVGQIGGIRCGKKGAADLPRTHLNAPLELDGLLAYAERLAAAIDPKHRI